MEFKMDHFDALIMLRTKTGDELKSILSALRYEIIFKINNLKTDIYKYHAKKFEDIKNLFDHMIEVPNDFIYYAIANNKRGVLIYMLRNNPNLLSIIDADIAFKATNNAHMFTLLLDSGIKFPNKIKLVEYLSNYSENFYEYIKGIILKGRNRRKTCYSCDVKFHSSYKNTCNHYDCVGFDLCINCASKCPKM